MIHIGYYEESRNPAQWSCNCCTELQKFAVYKNPNLFFHANGSYHNTSGGEGGLCHTDRAVSFILSHFNLVSTSENHIANFQRCVATVPARR